MIEKGRCSNSPIIEWLMYLYIKSFAVAIIKENMLKSKSSLTSILKLFSNHPCVQEVVYVLRRVC